MSEKPLHLWICPVCAGFWTDDDVACGDNTLFHCLVCDHHYPADLDNNERPVCHNCCAGPAKLVAIVRTDLTVGWLDELMDFDMRWDHKRGVNSRIEPRKRPQCDQETSDHFIQLVEQATEKLKPLYQLWFGRQPLAERLTLARTALEAALHKADEACLAEAYVILTQAVNQLEKRPHNV